MNTANIPIGRIIEKLDKYYSENDTVSAEKHLDYWISEALSSGDSRSLITLFNEQMGFYRKSGNKEKAFFCVNSACKLLKDEHLENSMSGATVYLNCGTVYTAFKEPETSLKYFKNAEKIYTEFLKPFDENFGGLYNNISLAYLALKDFNNAEKYCLKAISVMEKIKSGEPEMICTPKVRHFWRCIFLWVKQEEKTRYIVQNLK